jgi:hypothetical protein
VPNWCFSFLWLAFCNGARLVSHTSPREELQVQQTESSTDPHQLSSSLHHSLRSATFDGANWYIPEVEAKLISSFRITSISIAFGTLHRHQYRHLRRRRHYLKKRCCSIHFLLFISSRPLSQISLRDLLQSRWLSRTGNP